MDEVRQETPFAKSRYLRHVPPLEGDLFTRRHWIIVYEPNRIPEKKGSFKHDQVSGFLRELIACRPEGTKYTVVSLTWDFDIWVESGHEWLIADDFFRSLPAESPPHPTLPEQLPEAGIGMGGEANG